MSENTNVSLPVRWDPYQDPSAQYVNQLVAQLGPLANGVPDSVHVSFGVAPLPIITGPPEEIAQVVSAVGALVVRPLGRFVMSKERAVELRNLLDNVIQQYEQHERDNPSGGDR